MKLRVTAQYDELRTSIDSVVLQIRDRSTNTAWNIWADNWLQGILDIHEVYSAINSTEATAELHNQDSRYWNERGSLLYYAANSIAVAAKHYISLQEGSIKDDYKETLERMIMEQVHDAQDTLEQEQVSMTARRVTAQDVWSWSGTPEDTEALSESAPTYAQDITDMVANFVREYYGNTINKMLKRQRETGAHNTEEKQLADIQQYLQQQILSSPRKAKGLTQQLLQQALNDVDWGTVITPYISGQSGPEFMDVGDQATQIEKDLGQFLDDFGTPVLAPEAAPKASDLGISPDYDNDAFIWKEVDGTYSVVSGGQELGTAKNKNKALRLIDKANAGAKVSVWEDAGSGEYALIREGAPNTPVKQQESAPVEPPAPQESPLDSTSWSVDPWDTAFAAR